MTDRQITHAPGCWSWGPRHYECALREIERLHADLAESDEIREKLRHLFRNVNSVARKVMMKTTDKKTACSTCPLLNAAIEIIQNRNQLEWGYVPQLGVMGYYWKGQWVGGDTVDDAIHFIADRIDDSQPPKSMPSCCREQSQKST